MPYWAWIVLTLVFLVTLAIIFTYFLDSLIFLETIGGWLLVVTILIVTPYSAVEVSNPNASGAIYPAVKTAIIVIVIIAGANAIAAAWLEKREIGRRKLRA